ncbi:MAG: alpha-amylase family glycosyl hydrolase [Sumerlaeia bacterium]
MSRLRPLVFASALLAASLCSQAPAQGTASLTPSAPDRGTLATVTFDATGGPLAAASPVVMTVGFNGFQNAFDVTLTGTAPNWSGTFNVPSDATGIDIVFKNVAGSIFDNNGGAGVDWHFVVSDVLAEALGVTKVPPSEGGGYLFRLWAPDVTEASVVGDFNSFAGDADLMAFDSASGVWSVHVHDAAVDDEYKFLLKGSEFRRDPRGRMVRGAFDNSVIVDPTTYTFTESRPGTAADFRDWVVYEMHIGTLDPAGGIAPGTFGDLIPARLDYIADMGFNAVLVMPVNEFPGTYSGGYNLTEPFAIERDYGSPDDFRAFVDACHARGIAVIVDVVHNHYGPGGLDLYDFQDLNTNATRDEPGIYFYDGPPAELADSGFGPRPDYSEPQVRDFITDNIAMFLDEYNVDGFRWDFVKAMRGLVDGSFAVTSDLPDGISLLQDINSTLLNSNPDLLTMAEDLGGDARLTDPVSSVSGDPNDGYGFDRQWEVDFHGIMATQLATTDSLINMVDIEAAIDGSPARVHYLESHDEVWELNTKDRLPPRIDGADPESLKARKLSGLGAGILMTAAGMPMVFQGGELLDIGGPDADNSWGEDEAIDFSRLADPDIAGFNQLYKDLIGLRRNLGGATAGLLGDTTNVFHVNSGAKAIAYSRSNGGSGFGDTVVVLANFSTGSFAGGYDIGLPQAGTWFEVFNSDDTAYGTDFGGVGAGQTVATTASALHGFPQRGTVAIGPRSLIVLSQTTPFSSVADWSIME